MTEYQIYQNIVIALCILIAAILLYDASTGYNFNFVYHIFLQNMIDIATKYTDSNEILLIPVNDINRNIIKERLTIKSQEVKQRKYK